MEFILLCSHKAVKTPLPDLSCSNQKSALLSQQPSKQEAETEMLFSKSKQAIKSDLSQYRSLA